MKSVAILLLIATAAFAAKTGVQDQILSLLQTGTKASDAIDSVFELLNDLVESNEEAQYISDERNKTNEFIADATISKFVQIQNLNLALLHDADNNRVRFEQELKETKTYLAWNEARQEEIARKSQSLLDNQCFSNQLFVRSLKQGQEALDVVQLLKQDLVGYVAGTGAAVEFGQVSKTEIKSVADKLRAYSNVIHASEVQAFLQLADSDSSETSTSEDGESSSTESETEQNEDGSKRRRGTLPEQLVAVLDDLHARVTESLANQEQAQIQAAWELAMWLSSSEAEVANLVAEHTRKSVYADRCATQIQAALAAQAKANAILAESQDALAQAITDIENKRDAYAEEKSKRDEENAILSEVSTMFKNQVQSWSGR